MPVRCSALPMKLMLHVYHHRCKAGHWCFTPAMQQLCTVRGYFCPAGSVSSRAHACPLGRYGNQPGLTDAACSGGCAPGRYGAQEAETLPSCTANCASGYVLGLCCRAFAPASAPTHGFSPADITAMVGVSQRSSTSATTPTATGPFAVRRDRVCQIHRGAPPAATRRLKIARYAWLVPPAGSQLMLAHRMKTRANHAWRPAFIADRAPSRRGTRRAP